MTLKGWELDAVKSLSMHKGEYSEIFAMTPSGNGVVRFIPDDYHKILYSTDPDEVYAIDELKKTGLSTSESINKYLSDR
jgi:predicted TIM-barrel fold metal-dependent hydrolase